MTTKTILNIYTDGACKGNPGRGGWGIFWYDQVLEKDVEYYGYESNTTNNRMELFAIIKALENSPRDQEIIIHTDSQYVQKGITSWIHNWKKNGWKTAKKEPVANQDLWMILDSKSQGIKFE